MADIHQRTPSAILDEDDWLIGEMLYTLGIDLSPNLAQHLVQRGYLR